MIRARRAWNLLRARTHGGAVILLYHRVARPVHDPFGLCVSPENFMAHMEILQQMAFPTPLGALSARTSGIEPRSVAVTFDDAYEDVLTHALPVLETFGIPATVFAVSGILGSSFWWDRMTCIPIPLIIEYLQGSGYARAARGGTKPRSALTGLHGHLLPLAPDARDQILDRLLAGISRKPELPRTLTPEELRHLAASEMVEIGAHTQTHPNLAALEGAHQEVEVRKSQRVLAEILGAPVTSFSYPFGTFAHFDRATARVVERNGFERACTAEPGVVTRGTDPFSLPRLWVEDWKGEEFRKRLSAWLR
jgi:peptidoglycan/xylan/chitin deacetylase (PgdA/CDA1 family)